jgi:hypothetical protein
MAPDRESKADEFDEHDGLVAGEEGMPNRVAESPKDLRYMAKKTWLFLSITTLLNIHNTIDGGAPRASPPLLHPPARSQLTIATRVSASAVQRCLCRTSTPACVAARRTPRG